LTLEVDRLNPTKSFGVDNVVPIHQAQLKNFILVMYDILTRLRRMHAQPMGGHVKNFWNLVATACQGGTSPTNGRLIIRCYYWSKLIN
jgi:hypothetical protein